MNDVNAGGYLLARPAEAEQGEFEALGHVSVERSGRTGLDLHAVVPSPQR